MENIMFIMKRNEIVNIVIPAGGNNCTLIYRGAFSHIRGLSFLDMTWKDIDKFIKMHEGHYRLVPALEIEL